MRSAGSPTIGSPAKRIWPRRLSISPTRHLRKVVLPAPFAPMRATVSPASTWTVTPKSAWKSP